MTSYACLQTVVLGIHGGGYRGLLSAKILMEIERRTGKAIAQLIGKKGKIAGTSTGGILALGLTIPNADGTGPRYKAEELFEMYLREGSNIFAKSRTLPLLPEELVNLFRPKYQGTGREAVLDKYFGNAYLEDALVDVIVPSYDTELRVPIFFNNRTNKIGPNYHKLASSITMKQAAMATSAAPTFFPVYRLGNYSLIDGGLYANDPTLIAVSEALIDQGSSSLNELLIISIGTGSLTEKYPYQKIRNSGIIGWGGPIVDVAFDSQSEGLGALFEQAFSPSQYYRFQPILRKADDAMDNTSPGNTQDLIAVADAYIQENNQVIDHLCQQLVG